MAALAAPQHKNFEMLLAGRTNKHNRGR
jgi:hypothetical protein